MPNKILARINDMRIFNKLIIAYFFAAAIPVILTGVLLYNTSMSNIKKQSIDNLMQAQEKYEDNIVNNLARYYNVCDSFYLDQEIQTFVRGKHYDVNPDYYAEQQTLINNYLMPKILTTFAIMNDNMNLSIVRYFTNPIEIIKSNFDEILDIPYKREDFLAPGRKTQNYQIYNIDRLKNKEWFKKLKGNVNGYRWVQIVNDRQYDTISLVREMHDFNQPGSEPIGLLKLTVRLEDVLIAEKIKDNPQKGFSLFFDRNGSLISPEKEKKDYFEANKDMVLREISSAEKIRSNIVKNSVMIKRTIPSTNWIMLGIYPIEVMKSGARDMGCLVLSIFFAALLILFFVTYIISLSFSKRITNIKHYISSFQSENSTVGTRLNDEHHDELGYLARSYNEMTDRINRLITEVYKADSDKKEFELQALQAQINPHFLYNSLSSISRLSSLGDSTKVDYMVRSLTKFYRMTLNNGKKLISISDELDQVKAYVDIYNIRKKNFFNINFDIDQSILGYQMVKVILQPFVENIFEHAVYIRTWPININLSARKEGHDVVFEIIDDGVGMPHEKVESILSLRNTKSYGVKNVNERIMLQYGACYGVSIFSLQGIGTVVTVKVPANEKDGCANL